MKAERFSFCFVFLVRGFFLSHDQFEYKIGKKHGETDVMESVRGSTDKMPYLAYLHWFV